MSHYKTKKRTEDMIFTFVYMKKSHEESKIIHLWKAPGRQVWKKDKFYNVTCRGPAQGTVSFLSDTISGLSSFWSVNTGKRSELQSQRCSRTRMGRFELLLSGKQLIFKLSFHSLNKHFLSAFSLGNEDTTVNLFFKMFAIIELMF